MKTRLELFGAYSKSKRSGRVAASKFKEGDKVIIVITPKTRLDDPPTINPDMLELAKQGNVHVIEHVGVHFKLEGIPWAWHPKWLAHVEYDSL